MRTLPIDLPKDAIAEFCRRQPIARLALFGSVLRDDFGPESDVDFLVELVPNASVGIFEMTRMQTELSNLLGRKVDLRTPLELSRHFRDRVLAEADTLYVKAN
ncbi:MAG TPA: nucleotidyltransferase family protein [Phycisphaerae bacterium]|nr:nucleotidyltransferase family protein [Phycisphaerae bacterium]